MTSRDTEIERIDMDEAAEIERIADALVAYGFYTERGYAPSMSADRLPGVLYDAGLRSQPASEPSLDVARLHKAIQIVWGLPTDSESGAADAEDIAAEYARLSQPTEPSETDQE